MDGVIANFEKGVADGFRALYPDKSLIPLEQRTSFSIEDQYPPEIRPLIKGVYCSKGFFYNLQPIKGALEALHELSLRGVEVNICTSPLLSNPFCVQEKYDWILSHLNSEWARRVITLKDKTLIRADLLIDDKPNVMGVEQPTWEHILYSQPYNQHITSKRRITWQDWKSVLNLE